MLRKRAFVSFDVKNDKDLYSELVTQAKKLDSPLNIKYFSSKKRLWGKARDKRRMKNVDIVIVICGISTHMATGVSAELSIACEIGKPYFLLHGRKEQYCTRPEGVLLAGNIYTWVELKRLLGDATVINSDYKGPETDLFQQYKLYVESAEKNMELRALANRFMGIVNSIVLSASSYVIFEVLRDNDLKWELEWIIVYVPGSLGIMVSIAWIKIINQYKEIYEDKFRLITELEKKMPATVYTCERKIAIKERYRDIAHSEMWIARVFFGLYGVIYISALWKLFMNVS